MIRRAFFTGILSTALFPAFFGRLSGEDIDVEKPDRIPMPTLGGKQFWGDELIFHDWRIQRNVVDGQCRLLDGKNWRHASGTFDRCREVLDGIKRDRNLPPMNGRAVVVLHGLGTQPLVDERHLQASSRKRGISSNQR